MLIKINIYVCAVCILLKWRVYDIRTEKIERDNYEKRLKKAQ